jgi:hypothetical protein
MLNKGWLIEDPIDFEYKKYILLAYEKKTRGRFRDRLLYPDFTDIISNKNYIDVFIDNIYKFENGKKEIVGIDMMEQKIIYRSLLNDSSLDDIVETAKFAKSIFDDLFLSYSKLYDEIESKIKIDGSIISQFSLYLGYIVIDDSTNEKKYYDYNIEKKFTPDEMYVLELTETSEAAFFKNRFQKNYFNIIVPTKENFESTVKPILKRKFIKQLLTQYE